VTRICPLEPHVVASPVSEELEGTRFTDSGRFVPGYRRFWQGCHIGLPNLGLGLVANFGLEGFAKRSIRAAKLQADVDIRGDLMLTCRPSF